MIPPEPSADATASERKVFELLSRLEAGPSAVAFSSVHLSAHEYKKWGEIDFIVLTSRGLLVVEVKGGRVSCDQRGVWHYEARGKVPIERMESPMAQASSAYFSLRDKHLVPALGKGLVRAAPSGFLVILAHTTAAEARHLVGGPEMAPQLVGTAASVASEESFAQFLSGVTAHWREQERRPREWSESELQSLARAIRPWFDRVQPLSIASARVRQELIALTEDQYRVLDFCREAPRVLCTGGAGCGKTLLAIESLRREGPDTALLVTGTEKLAHHLRSAFPQGRDSIVSYRELKAGGRKTNGKVGCLIVDEGQQITTPEALTLLDELLLGGLDAGRWRWFSDPNNQILQSSEFDRASQERLEAVSFSGSLDRNCRNTPQILSTVGALTGATLGTSQAKGAGPEVEFVTAVERSSQVAAAANQVKSWLEDPDMRPGEIVLISPLPIEESSIPEVARLAGLQYRQWKAGWDQSMDHAKFLGAATVDDFRGLEAPFIVLCDITAKTLDPVETLYLGMTRANYGLLVMAEHQVILAAVNQASKGR